MLRASRVLTGMLVAWAVVFVGCSTASPQRLYTHNARARVEHRPSAIRRDIHDIVQTATVFVLNVAELRVDLTMQNDTSLAFTTRAYNGRVPGPTIYAVAGDTFHIMLHNLLLPGTANETSLHLHGLHVANDLTPVLPSQANMLTYHIPLDHPSGTYWYHPHRHGQLNSQISGLMAGAFIILDRVTDLPPSLQNCQDHVLLLQGVCTDGCASDYNMLERAIHGQSPSHFDPHVVVSGNATTTQGMQLLVNGESVPTLMLRPSTWTRLRFVNALANSIVELKLPCTSHLLARDGVTKDKWRQVDLLVIPPGGRADVAMQCPVAGSQFAVVVDRRATRNEWLGTVHHRVPSQLALIIQTVLADSPVGRPRGQAHVHSLEAAPPHVTLPWYMSLPPAMKGVAEETPPQCDVLYEFTTDKNPIDGSMAMGVNHVSMDMVPPGNVNVTYLRRNQSIVWCVGSIAGHSHPFHVHNTHFQVIKSLRWNSTQPHLYEHDEWRDTIPLYKDHVLLQCVHFYL
ncbi:hypothetical protein, variant [Aphanomyces invadans]|uniref:Plastocyanin-like domain-containing protein n=1 Tax=Aphanomyces invadans TaxID=157072 RepID=A0A024UGD1_9STRA|nr:hypothetical protein, variant [Aphanomyces invadans]ETW05451.1 hypothetical protein, variant [Aphanomyces invadans]|eukprot:XP_008865228.1 hypothetical protein, variant [Aphanomyces invadans]